MSKLPPEEVERRRVASVEALRQRDKKAFATWYQERCDEDYWRRGQCCAGCDHWRSEQGDIGDCTASGIVSGRDVVRSMGVLFSTYTPAPGFPFTRGGGHCGLFQDEFDWASLGELYLTRIGAMKGGVLKPKPTAINQKEPTE